MWKRFLSVWVIVFGVLGYLFSLYLSQSGHLSLQDPTWYYESILLTKELFFSSLKMLVAPIVMFSLLGGMIQISEVSQLGKIGKYTLLYYLSTTAIAIVIGLVVVFFIHPWKSGTPPGEFSKDAGSYSQVMKAPDKQLSEKDASVTHIARNFVKRIFVNPVNALVSNNILGIVLWSFLIGLAFIMMGEVDSTIVTLIRQGNKILNKILSWVILFAPIGVFAVAFDFQLKFSGAIIQQLISFIFVVFSATAVHGLLVLPLILKVFTGMSIRQFFTKSSKALVLAFSTSSSAATLPVSISVCEEDFKVKRSVASFVLPLGATMNMDGTALFEGVAAVFLAYVFGIELTSIGMISIFLMAVISSIGAPGMPSGSMSGMQMVLLAAGIPLEGIGILMLIERPLDTFRTAVNVQGDITGALVVNHILNND